MVLLYSKVRTVLVSRFPPFIGLERACSRSACSSSSSRLIKKDSSSSCSWFSAVVEAGRGAGATGGGLEVVTAFARMVTLFAEVVRTVLMPLAVDCDCADTLIEGGGASVDEAVLPVALLGPFNFGGGRRTVFTTQSLTNPLLLLDG